MQSTEELILENNRMLKRICEWIDKVEDVEYQANSDAKDFVINVAADLYVDDLLNSRKNDKSN